MLTHIHALHVLPAPMDGVSARHSREAAGPLAAFTEHPRDAARRLLADSEIDRAWVQGRAMSLEDAVAYARTW